MSIYRHLKVLPSQTEEAFIALFSNCVLDQETKESLEAKNEYAEEKRVFSVYIWTLFDLILHL